MLFGDDGRDTFGDAFGNAFGNLFFDALAKASLLSQKHWVARNLTITGGGAGSVKMGGVLTEYYFFGGQKTDLGYWAVPFAWRKSRDFFVITNSHADFGGGSETYLPLFRKSEFLQENPSQKQGFWPLKPAETELASYFSLGHPPLG